jgi:hypothetical protein
MSQWVKRIKDHNVWSILESLGPSIDKAEGFEDLTQEQREALNRLRTVLTFCGKRLAASDPLTIVPTTLDSITQFLSFQQSQVEAFVVDRNTAHLNDANANADLVLQNLVQIPGVCTSEELEVIS